MYINQCRRIALLCFITFLSGCHHLVLTQDNTEEQELEAEYALLAPTMSKAATTRLTQQRSVSLGEVSLEQMALQVPLCQSADGSTPNIASRLKSQLMHVLLRESRYDKASQRILHGQIQRVSLNQAKHSLDIETTFSVDQEQAVHSSISYRLPLTVDTSSSRACFPVKTQFSKALASWGRKIVFNRRLYQQIMG